MNVLLLVCALAGIAHAVIAHSHVKDIALPVLKPYIEKVPVPLVKVDFTKGDEIVKHVPQTFIEKVPVEKVIDIEKPVEVLQHVPVTKEVFIERPVEVIKEVPIEKVIIDKVEVPYEVIKHVEKIVHVPVKKHVEVIKQVEVIKEIPYKKYVFNPVHTKINYQVPHFVEVPYTVSAVPEKIIEKPYLSKLHDPIGLVKKLLHKEG
ncbi:uncharacterized protein LOC129720200 [Wyeomyia smithii]|uniref:uncharacterized protein LOC129720200 n=1 Tax=Wyeomyia smithii TaxID=174621 RepID=UPI002467EA48|nr:uncharacterized protein LOC129720200 [Wyeomyia smithii]